MAVREGALQPLAAAPVRQETENRLLPMENADKHNVFKMCSFVFYRPSINIEGVCFLSQHIRKTRRPRMCSMQKNKERICVPTLMNRTRPGSINKKINHKCILCTCVLYQKNIPFRRRTLHLRSIF